VRGGEKKSADKRHFQGRKRVEILGPYRTMLDGKRANKNYLLMEIGRGGGRKKQDQGNRKKKTSDRRDRTDNSISLDAREA